MKKILFTIQWYPPYKSANAICDKNIIKALQATKKYEIHCLVYKSYDQQPFEYIDGIYVHRFKRCWLWNLTKRIQEKDNTFLYKMLYFLNRILLRIKQIIFIPIYPVYEPFLVRKFQHEAMRIHEKEHFDIVISEHNGIDSLMAGYAIKKKYKNILFLPIFWDSLSGGFCPHYLPKWYARKMKRRLEHHILTKSDAAIVMESSMNFHQQTTIHYSYYKKLFFLNIPYLISSESMSNNYMDNILDSNKINILYTGTLSQRDPSYILNLLQYLDDNITLTFICDISFHKYLVPYKSKLGNKLQYYPYIPHDQLRSILNAADIFLNIGVREPNAISGKIFDYMSYGKPVISTYFIDNEAVIPYLKKYPLGLLIDERISVEENKNKLLHFIKNNLGKQIPFTQVETLFPTCSVNKYVELIYQLINAK